MRAPKLSEKDHNTLDRFLEELLNAHRCGRVATSEAVGDIMHVVGAVDKDNHLEAINYSVLRKGELTDATG